MPLPRHGSVRRRRPPQPDTVVPRVLLDVSPIGARPQSRTGLARVALSLAKGLAGNRDVCLKTCSWGSLAATDEFQSVRREFPELNGVAVRRGRLELAYMARNSSGRHPLPRVLWRGLGQAINRLRNPLAGVDLDAFDVVHSTYARFPRCLRGTSLPTVLTLHDLMPLRMPASYFEPGQAAITHRIVNGARSASWVACVSENTRHDFLDFTGYPVERAVVIPNGVDHGVFYPEADARFTEDVRRRFGIGDLPFVLTLSSLAPHKNLRMLIDAWSRCPGAGKGFLVAAGGRTTDPAALTHALGLEANARGLVLTGFLADEEFRALASSCQAFLFPSLYEGFGLPVLEALACGAPVICSNSTSLPEVVGAAGKLLDPNDGEAWTAAIQTALEMPLRKTPLKESLDRAAEFSWTKVADEYVRLYRKAIP